MTRLAFAVKCGCLGESEFNAGLAAQPFSRNKAPSAMAPRPTPHCSKNQRRVMSFGSWPRYRWDWQFITFQLPRIELCALPNRRPASGGSPLLAIQKRGLRLFFARTPRHSSRLDLPTGVSGNSSFELPSSFDIRHSDFHLEFSLGLGHLELVILW